MKHRRFSIDHNSLDKRYCRKRPCSECPFRKGTKHNGGSAPEVYVGQAMGPFLLACHMDPEYFDNPYSPSLTQCGGAAIFRANIGAAQRMPAFMLNLPADTEQVFATPAELIAHHRGISIAEAEEILKETPPEVLLLIELCKTGVRLVPVPRT